MKAGQCSPMRRSGSGVLLLVAWLGTTVTMAAASAASSSVGESARVLRVVVVDPGDPTLVSRIRGQTGDLGHSLSITAPPTSPLDEAAVTTIAKAEQASVVVWIERTGEGGMVIHVRDVARGDALTRTLSLADSESLLGGSALAEAAALIVRSALVSLSSGEALGPPPFERRGAEAAVPAPTREPTATPKESSPGASNDDRSDRDAPSFAANLGYEIGMDGAGSPFHGPRALGLFRLGRLALGVGGALGIGRDLDDGTTRVTLSRHAADGTLGLALFRDRRLELDADLQLGLALYEHRTLSRRPEVTVAPPGSVLAPRGGVGVGGLWFPGGGPLGFGARAGLDVLPGSIRLHYEESGERSPRTRLWALQPVAQLALVLRTAADPEEAHPRVDPGAQARTTSRVGAE